MAEKEEEKANTVEVSPEEPSGPLPDAEETDNSSSKTPEPRVPRLVLNGKTLTIVQVVRPRSIED